MIDEFTSQDEQFSDTHSDDFHILNYLLRRVKGLSPVAGEPIDGIPGVDDVINTMNS